MNYVRVCFDRIRATNGTWCLRQMTFTLALRSKRVVFSFVVCRCVHALGGGPYGRQ